MTTLLSYPNVSDGRNATTIAEVGQAFGPGLLDVHSDPDHHRSAYTLAGRPGELASAVLAGAARALELVRLPDHDGVHPRVGVLDVAPIVHLKPEDRGAACAEALVLADRLGHELALPVFLYGELAGGRTRAHLRRGGPEALARRLAAGELAPDFGPPALHPTAGAALVAARPAARRLQRRPRCRRDAGTMPGQSPSAIREGGSEGLAGVRAIGLWLAGRGVAQVSCNVEDPARMHRGGGARRGRPSRAGRRGRARRARARGPRCATSPKGVVLRGRATIEDALADGGRTA